jgi:hypothetical protein
VWAELPHSRAIHILVGVEYRLVDDVVDEANRQRTLQLTAPGFVQDSALQTRPEHMQLSFAHCPFETQQETIVEV